ncbi:MFS transporter, UMF1 family [Amycolatopsis xylanica]|uniref:MFS transporter, UMF1 family n=1 Tax=Amycolatopsis xylanica TaxID=589385 RepID=A0A1H2VCI8_9PSEU|nr:MFS transporter [Amycolatopsis xylanica]SDW66016.1 MFS transporter, UMF1 family [Amycolatopsis xylanica]
MTTVDTRRRLHRGWYFYDWANSPFYSSVTTVFGALYMSYVAANAAKADTATNGPSPCRDDAGVENTLQHCDISLFGLHFPAGSLWGYLISAATVLQVLVLPVTGAIADRSRDKKRILGWFALLGAVCSGAMFLVEGTGWQLGVVLFLIANLGYGGSLVVYYSFLPDIAGPDERDAVSARGWAFGYLGGGLALLLQLVLFLAHGKLGISQDMAIRIAFLTSGIWWAVFTIIPLRVLPARGGAHELPAEGSVLRAGFTELRQTVREAKGYPLTLAFLGCFLVFTDGISTVVAVSAQYGKDELKFSNQVLIVTVLLIQFVAYFGGMLHGLVARRFGAKKTILGSLVVWVLVIGFAYTVHAGDQVGFYGVAVGIGLVLGGTNALSRSLFAQMIPAGKEAQYFSLYNVGERGTSWLGPLVFAGIGQATGSFRLAIVALTAFFVIGFVLTWFVPVRRAITAAGNRPPAVL